VTIGLDTIGIESIGSTFPRTPPTVSITAPGALVESPTITVSWSYSSIVPRAQAFFRVRLLDQAGETVLYDSGNVAGSGTSFAVPFLLSSGSAYMIQAQASDGFDWSAFASTITEVELEDVSDFPDAPDVGSVYEIGLNGQGYMLADKPDLKVERQVSSLDPPRLATSDTPFTEAVERYTFQGWSDFSGGAGQRYLERERSNPARYYDSEGIDPFTDEGIRLLPATTLSVSDTQSPARATVAGSSVYVVTASGELTAQSSPGGSTTPFTVAGASAFVSVCSDGTNWYAADGVNIYRNNTAASAAAWSAIAATVVRWWGDRIVAVYDDGDETCVTTLSNAGTEEVAGGRFKYPDRITVPDLTAGDGYGWWIVNQDNLSRIQAWKLGDADTTNFTALTLPAGQKATSIGFYLGSVFVRAVEQLVTGDRCIIYRCVPNNGELTPERVCSFESASLDLEPGDFAGDDRYVYFSWPGMISGSSRSGVGCIDLSTGGWAKWMYVPADAGTGLVRSIVNWNGRVAFTVDGYGLVAEGTSPLTTGWIETSVQDHRSTLLKVYDDVRATFDPIPTGGTVAVSLTIDGGASYASAGATVSTAGQTQTTWSVGSESRSIGLRITLGATSASPIVRIIQVKLHPLPIVDRIVRFPINCADQLAGLNGQPLPVDSPGAGMRRARVLESLVGTRVKLQDVDWPVTEVSSVWEVIEVRVETSGVYSRTESRRVDSAVAIVTLRTAK
jgi:hypothetical protein